MRCAWHGWYTPTRDRSNKVTAKNSLVVGFLCIPTLERGNEVILERGNEVCLVAPVHSHAGAWERGFTKETLIALIMNMLATNEEGEQ